MSYLSRIQLYSQHSQAKLPSKPSASNNFCSRISLLFTKHDWEGSWKWVQKAMWHISDRQEINMSFFLKSRNKKRQLGRFKRRWKDGTEVARHKIRHESMDWIHVTLKGIIWKSFWTWTCRLGFQNIMEFLDKVSNYWLLGKKTLLHWCGAFVRFR